MKVFVCMGCDYDGDWITGVFDSRALAEAHLADTKNLSNEVRPTRIEEHELNRAIYWADAEPDM